MKKNIFLATFLLLFVTGCNKNMSYEETKEFYSKNELSLIKVLETFEKYPLSIRIVNLNYNNILQNDDGNFFKISIHKGVENDQVFYLKKNFNDNDTNYVNLKNIFDLKHDDIKYLCNILLDWNVDFIDYDTPGSLRILNLEHRDGSLVTEKDKESQIAPKWFYFKYKL